MGFNSAPSAGRNDAEKSKEQQHIQEANDFLRDDWQLAEGLEIDNAGEKSYISAESDPKHPEYPMTWNRNNNTLAAVSPDGHIMATPWSKRIEDRLRSLSFRRDESMAVPLSNGEMPAHPDVRKRWEEKQTKAKREIEDIQNDAEKKTG